MTRTRTRWLVPAVELILGLLIAGSLLGQSASPAQVAISFGVVLGYAIVLVVLQSRSAVASLLSGMPRDERWDTINLRALSLASQVLAVALVAAFLGTQLHGGEAIPYALMGGLFAIACLGGVAWYRAWS